MSIDRERVLTQLRDAEGFRDTAYQDPMDVWTIGYGHTYAVRKGMTCTREQAEEWLAFDLACAVRELGLCLPWTKDLPVAAEEALVRACFNLGITRLVRFSKMLEACRKRRWAEAVYEAWDSRWAKQVPHRVRHIARGFVEADAALR